MTNGYVALHCDTGWEVPVYESVLQIDNVIEATIVMGVYDVMCKLETNNAKDLEDTVMKIRKIPHVLTTTTLLVF